jgi:hypothetical protein
MWLKKQAFYVTDESIAQIDGKRSPQYKLIAFSLLKGQCHEMVELR